MNFHSTSCISPYSAKEQHIHNTEGVERAGLSACVEESRKVGQGVTLMAFHGLKDHSAEIILRTPFGDETRRVDLNNS